MKILKSIQLLPKMTYHSDLLISNGFLPDVHVADHFQTIGSMPRNKRKEYELLAGMAMQNEYTFMSICLDILEWRFIPYNQCEFCFQKGGSDGTI